MDVKARDAECSYRKWLYKVGKRAAHEAVWACIVL